MLAENLVDVHYSSRTEDMGLKMEQDAHVECKSTDAPGPTNFDILVYPFEVFAFSIYLLI